MIALAVLVLSACGSFGASDPSTPNDGGPRTGANLATDAATDGGPALDGGPTPGDGAVPPEGGVVDCTFQIPSWMKTCMVDADCAIAPHTSDGCGNILYVGITNNPATKTAFLALDDAQTKAKCACTGTKHGDARAEDGVTYDPARTGIVHCVGGIVCKTYGN